MKCIINVIGNIYLNINNEWTDEVMPIVVRLNGNESIYREATGRIRKVLLNTKLLKELNEV